MIKVCIFDIDGVISSHTGEVDEKLLLVIEKMQAKGIICTVATGRIFTRAVEAIKNFRPNGPLILENSGRITGLDGKDLIVNKMDGDYIERLQAVLRDKNLQFAGFCPLGQLKMYFFAPNKSTLDDLKEKYSNLYGEMTDSTEEFMGWLYKLGCVRLSAKALAGKYLELANFNWTLNKGFYNLNAPGISKATGVLELSQRFDIKEEEILVVGNDDNDRALFRINFEVKIAVKPCPEALIKTSTHQIDDLKNLAGLLEKLVF